MGVTALEIKPLRIELDAAARVLVDVHQVLRDEAGNVLRDEILQHVHLVEDAPVPSPVPSIDLAKRPPQP